MEQEHRAPFRFDSTPADIGQHVAALHSALARGGYEVADKPQNRPIELCEKHLFRWPPAPLRPPQRFVAHRVASAREAGPPVPGSPAIAAIGLTAREIAQTPPQLGAAV